MLYATSSLAQRTAALRKQRCWTVCTRQQFHFQRRHGKDRRNTASQATSSPGSSSVFCWRFVHMHHHRIAPDFSADVEGHLGTDGRFYLLDLARAFPPESAADCPHLPQLPQAVFVRLLRPELLQSLKESGLTESLNPDCFTLWCRADPSWEEHEQDVRQVGAKQFTYVVFLIGTTRLRGFSCNRSFLSLPPGCAAHSGNTKKRTGKQISWRLPLVEWRQRKVTAAAPNCG